ncbi:hypothetical protein PORCRE_1613 [Porphyromonas crevioricanis JCM 15906]|uniref:Uncharacterized protein n=1 Tax=Porphyromonas crevioricanis JCM 15906 TaxID=1305617 RepID=T1CS19_9PORP|nr:hypothetical protein PORCRE_1613 [Porphyromonas crevioricanis JCM 15906]
MYTFALYYLCGNVDRSKELKAHRVGEREGDRIARRLPQRAV